MICHGRGESIGHVRLGEETVFRVALKVVPEQFRALAAGEDHFQVGLFDDEHARELPAGD